MKRRSFLSWLAAAPALPAVVALAPPGGGGGSLHTVRRGIPSPQCRTWVQPSPSHRDIIEILQETNEVLADLSWVDASRATTIHSPVSAQAWRKLYSGVVA